MKKFLLSIGIFIIILGLLGILLDWTITTGLHKRTDYVQDRDSGIGQLCCDP